MSRNSFRGLTLALVLIVGLGVALPAAARPAERGLAVEEGALLRLWHWVEHLWSGQPQQDKGMHPVTGQSGVCDPDRGAALDPNGNPCNK